MHFHYGWLIRSLGCRAQGFRGVSGANWHKSCLVNHPNQNPEHKKPAQNRNTSKKGYRILMNPE